MPDYNIGHPPFENIARHRLTELMELLSERLSGDDYARSCRLIEAVFHPGRAAVLTAADAAAA